MALVPLALESALSVPVFASVVVPVPVLELLSLFEASPFEESVPLCVLSAVVPCASVPVAVLCEVEELSELWA